MFGEASLLTILMGGVELAGDRLLYNLLQPSNSLQQPPHDQARSNDSTTSTPSNSQLQPPHDHTPNNDTTSIHATTPFTLGFTRYRHHYNFYKVQ
ncbi:hypothetical protein Pcinc_037843 [Petrolisthes cinctipes]|uniref:Uncharacterized protein n=1 Tax=Petrolisthes cinctipes TaxID=88211 RepID=A0AAE1EKN7_PETCI|nr:hypothetical protein Pcinc_037843 [Petrolisthes cinctipes]